MKRIDVRKSTIYTGDIGSVSSCLDNGYLGAKGYFTNVSDCMCDTDILEGVLKRIVAEKHFNNPYLSDVSPLCYKFFIPFDELVFIEEQPAKKYRPYLYLNELPFKVGDVVIYRGKQCCSECKGIVTEIEYQNDDTCELDNLIIGGINGTPQELFDHYEFLNEDCEWVPFGVEEDEKD